MHPQEKVQAELDSVLGPDRPPRMLDKPVLPYTEVTMKGRPKKVLIFFNFLLLGNEHNM